MATITPPTAQEVFNLANVTKDMLGATDDAEVKRDVANLILPGVAGRVELAADEAAAPYNFPFDAEIVALAYPDENAEQRTERGVKTEAMFKLAMLNFAAAAVHRQVRRPAAATFASDSSGDKAMQLDKAGEAMLAAAVAAVTATRTRAQVADSDPASAAAAAEAAAVAARLAAEAAARSRSGSVAQVVTWI